MNPVKSESESSLWFARLQVQKEESREISRHHADKMETSR